MKRNLRSVHDARQLSLEEQKFDNWKMKQMFEMGIACTYGSCNSEKERMLKIELFGSEVNHMKAENTAIECINAGKEVPETISSLLKEYKKRLSLIE